MKALRTLLATVVAACGLVLLAPAPPAAACRCALSGPATYVEWADVVFVGTLTGPPTDFGQGPPLLDSSTDPLGYTFDVEAVFKGDVSPAATVQSARFGASCGLEGLKVGGKYAMFAETGRGPDDALSANLCGGSQLATPRLIQRVEALTGPAETPTADPTADPTAGSTDTDPGGSAGTPPVGYLLTGFSVLVLAAVAWVLLSRRRPNVADRA
jgi:hypothetical protein